MSRFLQLSALGSACLMTATAKKSQPASSFTINPNDFEEHVFENQINHFDVRDYRTYNQRYWVNTRYWPED